MIRTKLFLLLPLLFTACNPKGASTDPQPEAREIVEVLQHDEGTFTQVEAIPVGGTGSAISVEGTTFTVRDRWPHAEAAQRVEDDAEDEFHAVEVSWEVEDGEEIQWVFQLGPEGSLDTIEALGAKVGVTRAGARPPVLDDESLTGQVQFLWNKRLYDLPAPGGEVFEGWTLKEAKTYLHALMDEEGGVSEAEDADFANRVLEVFLTDGQGSEERHLAFLDHPEITKGIHPTILPVYRVGGTGTSLSRLEVCVASEPNLEHQVVRLSPASDGPGLTVRIWPKSSAEFQTLPIAKLPAEVPLADGKVLHLKQHLSHARPHVKWERFDAPSEGEAKPALLIEHRVNHHQKTDFVLIRGEVTPCRVGDQHLMLRYTSSASSEESE